MLPDSIQLIVVTPEKQLLRETVSDVQLPGANGDLGVLPGHAPLITELGIGELITELGSGEMASKPIYDRTRLPESSKTGQPPWQPADLTVRLAVIGGFAEVLGERVTVLAQTAEREAEIDLARAERALKRAQ